MRNLFVLLVLMLLQLLVQPVYDVMAETSPSVAEKSMSETLDSWRDGQYERLYDRLSNHGKTSREQFVKKMQSASAKPACCWQKLENFKVLNEKRNSMLVHAKIGLDNVPGPGGSSSRDFKLKYEEGIWKMQMNDVLGLAGVSGKKSKRSHYKRYYR